MSETKFRLGSIHIAISSKIVTDGWLLTLHCKLLLFVAVDLSLYVSVNVKGSSLHINNQKIQFHAAFFEGSTSDAFIDIIGKRKRDGA